MNTRPGEFIDRRQGLRISRDIPVTWAISGVVTVLLSAGGLGVMIDRLIDSNKELTLKINQLVIQVSAKDLKDIEHDVRLNDLNRRVNVNEEQIRQIERAHK